MKKKYFYIILLISILLFFVLICCTRTGDVFYNLPLDEVKGKDTIIDTNFIRNIKGDREMMEERDENNIY